MKSLSRGLNLKKLKKLILPASSMFSYLIKLQLKYHKRERKKKERGAYIARKVQRFRNMQKKEQNYIVIIHKRGRGSLHLHFKPIFIIFVLKEKL